MRLDKMLSSLGVASRSGCRELVKDGRVTVNGRRIGDAGGSVTEADEICLVYQHYRSILQQVPSKKQLLPISLEKGKGEGSRYLFEPDRDSLLEKLLQMYLDNMVHSVLLEARAGEHSARMTAMSSAADNTEELIEELTLELNHARQSAITTEISEIVGGAAALHDSR